MRISDWSSDVCSSDLLDLGVAAEALRLLAHVEHRQAEPFGDPRREGDAGGLATGDAVDRLVAGLALNQRAGEVHELRAGAREGDDLAAVDVDGADRKSTRLNSSH